ncbi:MAG: hypothetical protein H6840_02420 [Planctomycetes bacterium]|nr:hypothetical protein [Planctomycetota bacterium]
MLRSTKELTMRVLLMLLVLGAASTAQAQDQNYWFQQFGTRSHMLGGSVVGGVDDTSAGFYNPARLAWIDNPELSVSATVYQLDRFFIRDGAGKEREVDALNWRVVPSLVSGIHLFDFAPGHAFGHTILARHYYNNSVSARREARDNVINDLRSPGDEDYTAQITVDVDVQEYWLGLSWAWRMTEFLSVGATTFAGLRIERLLADIDARAVWFNGTAFEATAIENSTYVNYFDLRAFWKLGLALELDDFKAGLTATTQPIHLWGQGTISRDLEILNIDADADGIGATLVLNDRQDSRPTEYRSPWSFAAGLDYSVAPTGTRFCASVEWFLPVGTWTVIRPESGAFFQGATTLVGGSNDFLKVRHGTSGVFNVAAGVSQKFGDWLIGEWTGHWAFYTDFSANLNKHDDAIRLGSTEWDLYHGMTGVSIRTDKSEFGIGVHFTIGSDSVEQNINLDDPTEAGLLLGTPSGTRGVYWAIGVVAGYTYFF